MFHITPQHKIFIAVQSIDFRSGIDGIAAICQHQYQLDPKSGHVFLFHNRHKNAIKILVYDSQGFWLCHKRLSFGKFKYLPKTADSILTLTFEQLKMLIYNNDSSDSSKTLYIRPP